MQISNRPIGPGQPVFIVAEISCNHNGSLELARQLVHAAKAAGADAVKFQMYRPEELTVDSAHPSYVMTSGPWKGRRLFDLYTEAQTPWEWMPELFDLARSIDIIPFASVFSPIGVEFLESIDCPAYKIASAEVTDLGLVRAVAETGKPVILSDGCASPDQLDPVYRAIHRGQRRTAGEMSDRILLRCVSEYPAPPESYGLGDYARFERWIYGFWGLSDHTPTNDAAVAAVALGACVVEKHLMLPCGVYGDQEQWPLDWQHSLPTGRFAAFVQAIRRTEAMLQPRVSTQGTSSQWRRRLVFARDLPVGHTIEGPDLRTARCGKGWEPERFRDVIGYELPHPVSVGDPVDDALVPKAPSCAEVAD